MIIISLITHNLYAHAPGRAYGSAYVCRCVYYLYNCPDSDIQVIVHASLCCAKVCLTILNKKKLGSVELYHELITLWVIKSQPKANLPTVNHFTTYYNILKE